MSNQTEKVVSLITVIIIVFICICPILMISMAGCSKWSITFPLAKRELYQNTTCNVIKLDYSNSDVLECNVEYNVNETVLQSWISSNSGNYRSGSKYECWYYDKNPYKVYWNDPSTIQYNCRFGFLVGLYFLFTLIVFFFILRLVACCIFVEIINEYKPYTLDRDYNDFNNREDYLFYDNR